MAKPLVKMEGFRELDKALRAAGNGAEKEFRAELRSSPVMNMIVRDARTRLEATYGKHENTGIRRVTRGKTSATSRPSRSKGTAAASIRILANSRGVAIVGGKARVPYYGWLDFGGDLKPVGNRKNMQKRKFLKRGRAMYPAIDKHRWLITGVAEQAMENNNQKAGLHE